MGIARVVDKTRETVLGTALLLSGAGVIGLGLVDGPLDADQVVSPRRDNQLSPAFTRLETPTTRHVRMRITPSTDAYLDATGDWAGRSPTAPPEESPGAGATPDAQFDVAVPVLGAQASAGDGDGSCTTVSFSALAPSGCPQPDGDGPVVIRYQGTGVAPKLNDLGTGREEAAAVNDDRFF